MFIPYGTDAPIYHYPIATVGLIFANVLVFSGTTFQDPELINFQHLMIEFGAIKPVQWITSAFMHADFGHILGNMLFLWVFGVIVEGKLGWWRFLVVYFAIVLGSGAVEQLGMFLLSDREGSSLGASAVIFGLMAIALVWAPKNDIQCFLVLWFRPYMFSLSVSVMAVIYLAFQIIPLILRRFSMSSELLHIIGFGAGLPIGIYMLKKDWVDCEGWDWFSVYAKHAVTGQGTRREREKQEQNRSEHAERKAAREAEMKRLNKAIQDAVQSGELMAACAVYKRHQAAFAEGKGLENATLNALVPALQKLKQWELVIPLQVEWLRRVPAERSTPLRLNLAQILIQVAERPRQAIVVLDKLPSVLTAEQKQKALAIRKAAEKALAAGNYEIDVFDW